MVNPSEINCKELLALLDSDKTKGKPKATKALMYIFFRYDLSDDNPLSDIPYNKKREEALLRAYGDKDYDLNKEEGGDVWKNAVEAAGIAYRDEVVPDYQKDIAVYDKKMDQTREMLKITAPKIIKNEGGANGSVGFSTNIDIINKSLASILTIIQTKGSLISMHVDGVVPKHLRGGLSPLSKGKIKLS